MLPTVQSDSLAVPTRLALAREPAHDAGIDQTAGVAGFAAWLQGRMMHCRRRGISLALVWVELDFPEGLSEPARVLFEQQGMDDLGRRVQRRVRSTDHALRTGAFSFGVALPGAGPVGGQRVSDRMRQALSEPYQAGEICVAISARVGHAQFPDDAGTAAELVHRAQQALRT